MKGRDKKSIKILNASGNTKCLLGKRERERKIKSAGGREMTNFTWVRSLSLSVLEYTWDLF